MSSDDEQLKFYNPDSDSFESDGYFEENKDSNRIPEQYDQRGSKPLNDNRQDWQMHENRFSLAHPNQHRFPLESENRPKQQSHVVHGTQIPSTKGMNEMRNNERISELNKNEERFLSENVQNKFKENLTEKGRYRGIANNQFQPSVNQMPQQHKP
ncbi:hypothetical protein MHBO_001177, partial [Bonamia ostreae]